jgi:hypothetical protein
MGRQLQGQRRNGSLLVAGLLLGVSVGCSTTADTRTSQVKPGPGGSTAVVGGAPADLVASPAMKNNQSGPMYNTAPPAPMPPNMSAMWGNPPGGPTRGVQQNNLIGTQANPLGNQANFMQSPPQSPVSVTQPPAANPTTSSNPRPALTSTTPPTNVVSPQPTPASDANSSMPGIVAPPMTGPQLGQQPQLPAQPQQVVQQPQLPLPQQQNPVAVSPALSVSQPNASQPLVQAPQLPNPGQPSAVPAMGQQTMPNLQPLPSIRSAPISQASPAPAVTSPVIAPSTNLDIAAPSSAAVKGPNTMETMADPKLPQISSAMVPNTPSTPQIDAGVGKTIFDSQANKKLKAQAPAAAATSTPIQADDPVIPAPIIAVPADLR